MSTHKSQSDNGPSTSSPYEWRGRTYLPIPVIEARKNGFSFTKDKLIDWHRKKRCYVIGRKLKAKKFLARTSAGWRQWSLFFLEDDITEVERAPKVKKASKPVARRLPDTPGPDWIDTEETMSITGASRRMLILNRRNVGHRPFPGMKKVGPGKKPKQRRRTGNFHGEPALIRSETQGRREFTLKQIERWLEELASKTVSERPLVEFYDAGSDVYLHIVDFEQFQPAGRNGKRIKRFPFPGESGGIRGNPGESGGIPGNPGESRGIRGNPVPPIPNPNPKRNPNPNPKHGTGAGSRAAVQKRLKDGTVSWRR